MDVSDPERSELSRRMADLSEPLSPIPTDEQTVSGELRDIRALVFDVYGTLFISGSGDVGTAQATHRAPVFDEALVSSGFRASAALGDRGVAELTEQIQSAHATMKGEGVSYPEIDIREIWRILLTRMTDEGLIAPYPDPARIRRFAIEYECRVNPVWPMPGLDGMLAFARSRDLRLGIVSNAQFFTPLLFDGFVGQRPEQLGFSGDLCVWSYEEMEAKPSRRLYEKVSRVLRDQYGVQAAQALYIGNDMRNDIQPAQACGFKTALFAGDQRSLRRREDDPLCLGVRPDVIVTELKQIMDAMGRGGVA